VSRCDDHGGICCATAELERCILKSEGYYQNKSVETEAENVELTRQRDALLRRCGAEDKAESAFTARLTTTEIRSMCQEAT
jgi:hypothetical protein